MRKIGFFFNCAKHDKKLLYTRTLPQTRRWWYTWSFNLNAWVMRQTFAPQNYTFNAIDYDSFQGHISTKCGPLAMTSAFHICTL